MHENFDLINWPFFVKTKNSRFDNKTVMTNFEEQIKN